MPGGPVIDFFDLGFFLQIWLKENDWQDSLAASFFCSINGSYIDQFHNFFCCHVILDKCLVHRMTKIFLWLQFFFFFDTISIKYG